MSGIVVKAKAPPTLNTYGIANAHVRAVSGSHATHPTANATIPYPTAFATRSHPARDFHRTGGTE